MPNSSPSQVNCTDIPVSDNLENDVVENGVTIWDKDDSGIECIGATICNVFVFAGTVLAVFTLGFADTSGFFGDFDFALADFSDLAGSSQPDPFGLGNVEIDAQEVKDLAGPPSCPR